MGLLSELNNTIIRSEYAYADRPPRWRLQLICRADKLRGQAKASAWYDDPDDDKNINLPFKSPFTRRRANSRSITLRAEEGGPRPSGLRPVQSHSDIQRVSRVTAGGDQATVQHAATVPGATSLSRQHDENGAEIPEHSSPAQSLNGERSARDNDGDSFRTRQPKLKRSLLKPKRSLRDKITGDDWDDQKTKSENSTRMKYKFTVANQLRGTILSSWLNVMLVFIPAGFVVYFLRLKATIVFAINFLAIVPSIMMVSLAVDEIGLYTGDLVGALLNMSFSNAPQLISSILLLKSRQITVLKTSLLGSIISNLLLMLGLCMFFGGINRIEQHYNLTVAQTISMMLLLATLSLVIPTASHLIANVTQHDIVVQSRGTSAVIIFSYGLYLFFQLKTHIIMFAEPSAKTPKRNVTGKIKNAVVPDRFRRSSVTPPPTAEEMEATADEGHERREPNLSIFFAAAILIVFTVFIGFNVEFATSSIQRMVRQVENLSQTFVGFVILPLLSNDVTSIANAVKDEMNLCIALTLERCMQTALLVVPLIVIIAWGMGVEEMTLEFDGFSVAATFVSIIIVTYVIQDGKSNWLIGALLVKVYVIVALAAYFIRV